MLSVLTRRIGVLQGRLLASGILLGGVPGVEPGRVIIIGRGVVGTNAAKIALGLGARVTLFDVNLERLRYLDDIFNGQVRTVFSVGHYLEEAIPA